jgi:outer membrane protein OmpA-like peptidoglycan-associated protein
MKHRRSASRIAAALFLAFGLGSAIAQPGAPSAIGLSPPKEAFRLVERSDFSRYKDGKYVGHAYREARGSFEPDGDGYSGEFLVLEETLRDMRSAARKVDRTAPVKLVLGAGASLEVKQDSGYPSLRGLPAFPAEGGLEPGMAWTAEGSRALDFDDSGAFVLLPFLAQYRCVGIVDYRGKKALSLSAKFATRWNPAFRPGSEVISSASGSHQLDIIVDAESLASLFIRDRFDDTFVLAAGGSERRSGFSLYFFEGSAPIDRGATGSAIAAALGGGTGGAEAAIDGSGKAGGEDKAGGAAAAEDSLPGAGSGPLIAGEGPGLDETLGPGTTGPMRAAGLELDTSPEGLVLRVKDLRFVADSDEILTSEKGRLDLIASALKALPGKSFLIAGHSAGVGKAAGELELSILRAKRVTDELAARGIEASRLLYRGFGSGRPLAPNDTEEGRAKNRRVEITILD